MFVLYPKMERDHGIRLMGLLGLILAYFIVDELMGSLLMVYSENHVDRTLLGWEVPSAMLIATNPLIIIGCGPIFALFSMNLYRRMAFAFLCLGVAFAILFMATAPSMTLLIVSFALIALGELFLVPAVYSYCSAVSPKGYEGMTMSVVTLTFALASLLSGQVSQMTLSHGELFLLISIGSFILSLGLMMKRKVQFS